MPGQDSAVHVNLRDVTEAEPNIIRSQAVYRSSEVLGSDKLRELGIKSIIDLRETRHGSLKNKEDDKARQRVLGFLNTVSRTAMSRLSQKKNKSPVACKICSREYVDEGLSIRVYHAGIIQPRTKGAVFMLMPRRIKFQALFSIFRGSSPKKTVQPAVADPEAMGYAGFYMAVLSNSKARIAIALRVLLEETNFPLVLHCTHGKDRTGIIVMLLLLLCNVSTQAIEEDYSKSEDALLEAQNASDPPLKLEDSFMRASGVTNAKPKTMRKVLQQLKDKYGSVEGYIRQLGISDAEIDLLRHRLCKPGQIPQHSTRIDFPDHRVQGHEYDHDQDD